ncbi:MAG: ribosomal protein S18-alanine N-acetyltransferase [Nitrospirae bacterium]|nr:ribosomal protein S18-alanine N-acetyltransferase [Nitrospirota bacterium]
MRDLVIRSVVAEDMPQIINIEQISFSSPWPEASFLSELYNRYSVCRVAENNGTIAGYIFVRHISDECHIMTLAVHDLYRRKGVASILLKDMLSDVRSEGQPFIYLEVRASNIAAQSLYQKFGFVKCGIRKGYYASPEEDAVVMVKK